MIRLSDEQRRVLKALKKGRKSAKEMHTGVRTMIALAERKLIYVPTTFGNVAYPQHAVAEITEAGRVAVFTLSRS
jgi:hypothetical protein